MNKSNHVIITLLILAAIVCFAFSGCDSKDDNESVADSTVNLTETSTANETETDESENEKSDVSQKSEVPTDQLEDECGTMGLLKYRLIYYNIPRPFADIVGSKKCDEWEERYLEKNDGEQGNEDGMAMKAYVQYFNISREDFDKANLKWAKIVRDDFRGKPMMDPKDFANQETDEVFNGDIIYTFDDEIINEYYMGHPEEFYPYWYADEFEKAVEEGYTPRTTDWIDVDRMEADIVAKYGSVD